MDIYLNKEDIISVIRKFTDWEAYEWSRQDVIDFVINDESIRKIEVDETELKSSYELKPN